MTKKDLIRKVPDDVSSTALPGCVPVTKENLPEAEYVDLEIKEFCEYKCSFCGEWFNHWYDHRGCERDNM